MYVIKNAVKNIWRNNGRNILIGVIILGMITSTVVAFSINTTINQIIKDYKTRFGSEVSISIDINKVLKERDKNGMQRPPSINKDTYLDFADSEYVKETIFTSELPSSSATIKGLDENDEDNGSVGSVVSSAPNGDAPDMPTLKILGVSDIKSLAEFKEGKRKVIDGSMYKEKNECIISKDLAELNNIKVGDTIEVKTMDSVTHKLKVAGIYFDSTSEYGAMPAKIAYMNKRNEILCSFDTLMGMSKPDELMVDAKYFLKSPDMLDAFEKEVREKGLPEVYSVSTDEDSYNKIVGPVEGLGSITLIFILVVLGLGSVVLMLLNTLSIRERKYEIGVLRAMGMKKGKVALGLITESLMITVICLGIGIGAGSAASQPVSNYLLEKQVEAQKASNSNPGQNFMMQGNGSATDEDTISEIDVSIDGETLIKVTSVALLLALLSSSVGVRYITKYEPRKILTERS
ncbi:ABC transporter permease [Clostridium sp. UBA6640]|uniref:ABC transporter permease n=1 Tax=Clostridium sp. UBA6640 TaxID=1946370 RepID=UPI0025C29EF4|nr:FtsX-like permease family protein [Clostridium sp. UBA6640]